MAIALLRVDERLIHGQVVIAWGNHLRSRRYVVLDDDLADSEWEQDLYRLAVPPKSEARFHRVAEGLQVLRELRQDPTTTVVLFRNLTAAMAVDPAAWEAGDALNLGMLHHKEGSSAVRSYLYLDEGDRAAVKVLRERGVRVYGRDLPSSSPVDAAEILGNGSQSGSGETPARG